ncbi:MAG: phosphatase PAP2 family protein [Candidatus Micrarchaeota archaeon]|nr:phosphatase PAP2 family protein [Candidatus Micrarchaeota archaeon]
MISDPVSLALFYHQNQLITDLCIILDKFGILFAFAFLGLVYLNSKLNLLDSFKKRSKLIMDLEPTFGILKKRLFIAFIALSLAIASIQFIKLVYPQERPCTESLGMHKIECPISSSFPSTHTASAAVLVPFTIGTAAFIPSIIYYILMAFSRVYLGVHYLVDVLVASAFGFSWYFIAQQFLSKGTAMKIASKASNIFRGFLHLFFGLFLMFIVMLSSMYSLYPIQISLSILLVLMIVMFYLIHISEKGSSTLIHEIMSFASARDSFQGESAIWFMLGTMILIGFTQDVNKIIAGIYIVTIGDVASAAFSTKLKHRKSIFKNKNIISYFAFVLASIPATLILGIGMLPAILIAAFLESLNIKINDNFLLFSFLTFWFSVFS